MARKKTFTQAELYQATHDLILKVGYGHFTFQLLSKELGITRTGLYKHFSNKDELLNAYLNAKLEEVVEKVETTQWPTDYLEKLDGVIDLVFGYAETHQISSMVPTQKWTKENENDPNVIKFKDLHVRFFGFIQEVIDIGMKEGYLNSDIPSIVIIETIFHIINIPNHAQLPNGQRLYHVKKMLFEGILKQS